MRDTRLLVAVRYCINKYLSTDIMSIRLENKKSQRELTSERVNAGLQLICMLIIFILSALFIANRTMTVGAMLACIDYFKRSTIMFERISKRVTTIPAHIVEVERVLLLDEAEVELSEDFDKGVSIKEGEIKFQNVSFSYLNNKQILHDFSLEIKAGEKIVLVGRSGAGKSTIAQLLCRLYDVDDGNILIDNNDIKHISLHHLREKIALVQQENLLFDNTIRFNLIFTNNTNRDQEIWDVLEQVKLKELVENSHDKLETILSNQEVSLSGGEKQRLAMARALLKNAAIVIFDESTSALDPETESEVFALLEQQLEGKTQIMIAHKESTIKSAGKIAFIEDGKVAGYGTHEQLLVSCSPYKELFETEILKHNK